MARPVTTIFRVYDRETGELVAEGTSNDCGEQLGLRRETIRAAYDGTVGGTYKGYRIEKVVINTDEYNKTAIMNWDAFCEPLRKEFGIPVYRPKKETKNKK